MEPSMDILVADNIRHLARVSLRVLILLAVAKKEWLQAIQDQQYGVVPNHHEWDDALRPMVTAAFAQNNVRIAPAALEIYLGTDAMGTAEYIPWTLLVQNWVVWNSWLQRAPRDRLDHAIDADVLAWDASFELFPFELFQKIETDRGRLLVDAFLDQANAFAEAYRKKHGVAFANGPVVQLLNFLAEALETLWSRRGGSTTAVRWILYALMAPNTIIETAFRQWNMNDGNVDDDVIDALRQWLPHFFLGSNLPEYVISVIYSIGDSNAPDMTLQLNLPALLPHAVQFFGAQAPSPAWQRRLANVATVHVSRVQDITDVVADEFLVDLMRAYWVPVRDRPGWGVYKEHYGFADLDHLFR